MGNVLAHPDFCCTFSLICYSMGLEPSIKVRPDLKPQEDGENHTMFICYDQMSELNINGPQSQGFRVNLTFPVTASSTILEWIEKRINEKDIIQVEIFIDKYGLT